MANSCSFGCANESLKGGMGGELRGSLGGGFGADAGGLPPLTPIAAPVPQLPQSIRIPNQEFHSGLTSASTSPKRQMRRRDMDSHGVSGSATPNLSTYHIATSAMQSVANRSTTSLLHSTPGTAVCNPLQLALPASSLMTPKGTEPRNRF